MKKASPSAIERSPDLITPINAMFFDTDVGGGIHNLAYLRFIETARTLLCVERGMNWKKLKEMNVAPVVVRSEIDYLRPATFGDSIEVHSWVGEVTSARCWFHFKIFRPSDGILLATCQQILAFVKTPEGKVLRLPSGFSNSFMPFSPH